MASRWFKINNSVDRVYARSLIGHRYGWGLFKKVCSVPLAKRTQPAEGMMQLGDCGYFDGDGDWRTLVHLRNPTDVTTKGFEPVESGSTAGPDSVVGSLNWGPKTSEHAQGNEVELGLGIPIGPIPVEAGIHLKYSNSGKESAVLIVQNPVMSQRLTDAAEMNLIQWAEENSAALIRAYRETVISHGLWIITKMYTAKRAGVAVMRSQDSTVEFGITTNVPGVLELSPAIGYTRGSGDTASEIHEHEDGVVVFISGIYLGKPLLRRTLKAVRDTERQEGRFLRGEGDIFPIRQVAVDDEGVETDLALTIVPETIVDEEEGYSDEDQESEDDDIKARNV